MVDVTVDDDTVVLRVTDDGVGVDQHEVLAAGRQGHLGVLAMRDAVGALGGRLELRRHRGGGTVLRVELPLRPQ
jgi:signal transduction histidine kinase